jgi:signal transduction histidine kinase
MLASKIDSDLKGKFDKISNRIQTEVARLGDLMNDVLLLGKLNANVLIADVEINDVIVDIKEVVERLNFIQPDNRKAEIIIEGKKENVLFDKKLFSHAFHNLLENAFKYSRNKPSPKIIVTYSSDIKIQVIDYGKGISEEDLSKLFQPFFRSDSTQDIEGTGLGLVICKRYIELQKGTIEVQSKIDFETKFTILFPLQDEQSINY